jgi:hypothetical protein
MESLLGQWSRWIADTEKVACLGECCKIQLSARFFGLVQILVICMYANR